MEQFLVLAVVGVAVWWLVWGRKMFKKPSSSGTGSPGTGTKPSDEGPTSQF